MLTNICIAVKWYMVHKYTFMLVYPDILGYTKTIESLLDLRKERNLRDVTKEFLNKKTLGLVRAVITIKASSNLKLSNEEKKI